MQVRYRERCLLYSTIWWSVGLLLLVRAWPYFVSLRDDGAHVFGVKAVIVSGVFSMTLGWFKGRTALRKSAHRALGRIEAAGEMAPLRSLWDWPTLALVFLMVCLGTLIRHSDYDQWVKTWLVATIYPAVSLALFMGGWTVCISAFRMRK